MSQNLLLRAASLVLALLSTGCESMLPSFYTITVRQGNYLDQEAIAQLKPGMTKQQVRSLMGTPLVSDPFHQNRWDYYYQYGRGSNISEQRHVTLLFSGETLATVQESGS